MWLETCLRPLHSGECFFYHNNTMVEPFNIYTMPVESYMRWKPHMRLSNEFFFTYVKHTQMHMICKNNSIWVVGIHHDNTMTNAFLHVVSLLWHVKSLPITSIVLHLYGTMGNGVERWTTMNNGYYHQHHHIVHCIIYMSLAPCASSTHFSQWTGLGTNLA